MELLGWAHVRRERAQKVLPANAIAPETGKAIYPHIPQKRSRQIEKMCNTQNIIRWLVGN